MIWTERDLGWDRVLMIWGQWCHCLCDMCIVQGINWYKTLILPSMRLYLSDKQIQPNNGIIPGPLSHSIPTIIAVKSTDFLQSPRDWEILLRIRCLSLITFYFLWITQPVSEWLTNEETFPYSIMNFIVMNLNAEFNKEYSAASDFMKMNYPFANGEW